MTTPPREVLPEALAQSVERGLADSAAGQTVDLGDFTRYAVDLDHIEWSAIYVEPGTRYPDEPSEMIDPGWYIHGRPSDEDDPRDASPFILKVEAAYDEDGYDVAKALAASIVGTLNERRYGMRLLPLRFAPFIVRTSIDDAFTDRTVWRKVGFGYGRMLHRANVEVDRLLKKEH